MKKVLSTIMAILIATGLSACGCGNRNGTDNNTGAGAGANKENSTGTETGNNGNMNNGGNKENGTTNNSTNNGTNGGTTNGTNGTNNGTTNGNGSTATKKSYKDGTYTGKGEKWEYGSEESVVTIKNGKITNIELRRLDNNGKEIDYTQWTGKEVNGTTYPNLNQYRKDLAKTMMNNQSAKADVITGATVSCENWITATQRALDQAMK